MSFKALNAFLDFNLESFLIGKRLVFVKAVSWSEGEGKDAKIEGSKVILQITEDKTKYPYEGVDNFGEQFTVKVRGMTPAAFQKLQPLVTEVIIADVERATVWGDFRNELSVIAAIKVSETK
jgi:hypothetical protein